MKEPNVFTSHNRKTGEIIISAKLTESAMYTLRYDVSVSTSRAIAHFKRNYKIAKSNLTKDA